MASLGGIDAYMEQWLKTATKGNVRFTMAFLANRMHLHCDVCHVGLTCPKPEDANTIDYAVQEYVKLHAHKGDAWKYDKSQMTDQQLAKKIAELQLGDKKKAQEAVGEMPAKVKKKQLLKQLELQEIQAKILWAKSQLKQVPSVIEHTPPPPRSAPVSDVFEDKGRKFR